MVIVGIAGGSGSGKSTIAYRLIDTYPKISEVLNIDDYQKVQNEKGLPRFKGKINWDHPDAIDWEKLLNDIKTIQAGSPVTILTWSHRSNPNYFIHKKMIPRTIFPRRILIIEGYLALWNKTLRSLYKRSYYLDLDYALIAKRRKKFEDPDYDVKVLIPMHKKYVEPTKKYADLVIDASQIGEIDVFKKIEEDLQSNKLFL